MLLGEENSTALEGTSQCFFLVDHGASLPELPTAHQSLDVTQFEKIAQFFFQLSLHRRIERGSDRTEIVGTFRQFQ